MNPLDNVYCQHSHACFYSSIFSTSEREAEFMKFAQKLRDNVRKKWLVRNQTVIPLAEASNEEILAQLCSSGQRLLEFR